MESYSDLVHLNIYKGEIWGFRNIRQPIKEKKNRHGMANEDKFAMKLIRTAKPLQITDLPAWKTNEVWASE